MDVLGLNVWHGRPDPGMRQVVGLGDRSTRKGNFGAECGAHQCNQWRSLRRYWAKVRETSELRFEVVRGVGRGIAVLDGGPRRTREWVVWELFPDLYNWEFPLRRCKPAA